jgi:hypothetical protein
MMQWESRLDCELVLIVERGLSEPMKMLFQIMEGEVILPVWETDKVHFSILAREKAILEHENGNKIMIMLRQLNCRFLNGAIHLDLREDILPDLRFISTLLQSKTLVMAPCVIKSGSIECPFYFHSSEIQELSDIILQSEVYYEEISDLEMPKIAFFGKTGTDYNGNLERYSHKKLYSIRVREKLDMDHPVRSLAEHVFGKFGAIYGEIQSYSITPVKSWVMFPQNVLNSEYDGLKSVQEKPFPIYSLRSEIVLVEPVFSEMIRLNFFWYRASVKLDDSKLEIDAVVDKDNLQPLLSVIHEIAASNRAYNPVLVNITPMN